VKEKGVSRNETHRNQIVDSSGELKLIKGVFQGRIHRQAKGSCSMGHTVKCMENNRGNHVG